MLDHEKVVEPQNHHDLGVASASLFDVTVRIPERFLKSAELFLKVWELLPNSSELFRNTLELFLEK